MLKEGKYFKNVDQIYNCSKGQNASSSWGRNEKIQIKEPERDTHRMRWLQDPKEDF